MFSHFCIRRETFGSKVWEGLIPRQCDQIWRKFSALVKIKMLPPLLEGSVSFWPKTPYPILAYFK